MLKNRGQLVRLYSGREVSIQSQKKQEIEQLYGAEYSFYSSEPLETVEQLNNQFYITALVYDYRDKGVLGHMRYLAKLATPCKVMVLAINSNSGAIESEYPLTIYAISQNHEKMIDGYSHSIYFYGDQGSINLGYRLRHEGSIYVVDQRHQQWGRAFFNATAGG